MVIDEKTAIAPQDRSIPAVKMIKVCPAATAPTIATCCRISEKLDGVKKFSLKKLKIIDATTSTIVELSHGYLWRVAWIFWLSDARSWNSDAASYVAVS
jgi:hypothetical protein